MPDVSFDALAARLVDPTSPAPAASEIFIGDDESSLRPTLMLQEHGNKPVLQAATENPGRRRPGRSPAGAFRTDRGCVRGAGRAGFQLLECSTANRQSGLVRKAVTNCLVQRELVR